MSIFIKRVAAVAASLSVLYPAIANVSYAAGNSQITALEKKIADQNGDLEKIKRKIDEIDEDIQKKTDELTEVNSELDKLEEQRLQMYDDIKLRIKYLYENGDTSLMEVFATDEDDYTKILNRSDLTQKIHEYDRQKLQEYADLIDDIKKNQQDLDSGINELKGMRSEQEKLVEKLEAAIKDDEDALKKYKEEQEKKKKELERKQRTASSKPVPSGTVQRIGNTYSYCQQDLELMYAITAQECCASYDGALAVITCACNRAESSKWGYIGSDPLTQFTAKNQFAYSLGNQWKRYLNNNVPQYVRDAVTDALNGKRSHQFLSFRGYVVAGGTNIGGNYYFSPMN